jgi:hypothetical protein
MLRSTVSELQASSSSVYKGIMLGHELCDLLVKCLRIASWVRVCLQQAGILKPKPPHS